MPHSWILVTGAAGFIASHLIERLLKDGQPVVGLDNFDPFYAVETKKRNISDLEKIAAQSGTPFQVSEEDITHLSSDCFREKEFSSVIHLAAKAGVRPSLMEPEAYLRTNVVGTLRVLEYCRTREIPELLFGSSSSVYGNDSMVPFREDSPATFPISPYAASKRAAELYCHAYAHLYGMKIASLRFFTVYGPRQRPDLAIHKFAAAILARKPIKLFGDGTTERDYTFVSDIVDGVMGARQWVRRQKPGRFEAFNLGGGSVTPLKKLVELLEKNLGVRAKIEWTEKQPGDVEKTHADTSKSQKTFGYYPKMTIEEGISQFADWYRGENSAISRAA